MPKQKLIIGTRGSKLALWQAKWVQAVLSEQHRQLEVEIRIIHTTGDKILDTALSKIGDKGLFTKEIEQQLLDGAIDLAVHSLKDLPTEQPEGLILAVITARENPADVLVSKNNLTLEQLPSGALMLTGSLRRRAQLLNFRPDLKVNDVRGNVHTRLRKLEENEAQGIILAAAGLIRMELDDRITEYLDPLWFAPACGQGSLALEIRTDDRATAELIAPLDDQASRITITAERTVLARLEGGCQIPIGAFGQIKDGQLNLWGMISDIEGKQLLKASRCGSVDEPTKLGEQIATELLDKGGKEILVQISQNL